ncbi:MAG: hypothetical protein QOJ39_222 [Candidatus Eremiobacteraeota bacterium]|nr:hypothetical protein [Candidatus Eremiobacteraeota bacterium]
MDVLRFRALRWIIAGLGVLLVCLALPAAPVRAGTSSVDVGDQVVLNVIVRGKGNDVAVRVWDRSSVQVDYAEESAPAVVRRSAPFGTPRFPLAQQIPPQLFTARSPDGQLVGGGALPPEEFPYASFRPGPHDVVHIDAPEGSHLVLTIPASTGILVLRVGGGQTVLEGYRGANLFLIQGQGRVQVTGATTTAFVQMNYGVFYTSDSTFDRIRLRGIAAHDVFERCRTKQIEASSVTGSIVYDGGSFDPGLARFESQTGSIALGVTSAAQLTGRSQDGHVYTMFDRRGAASVEQHGEGEAVATVGGGGPLVNAISGRGNVYFYEGSLVNRRATSPEWRAVHQLFNTHRRAPNASPGGRPHRGASTVRARL